MTPVVEITRQEWITSRSTIEAVGSMYLSLIKARAHSLKCVAIDEREGWPMS
eukprot:CAMPEP_0185579838 /NCGR_PEP_ID=MMETSP0434-20130131/15444_1 /TAXON_ID=626734 ORGANISM="Favella taraikaensis, Strain Fe Narragansett Bay" /NCGR_SAMPLE_ID=MMETSP0434 /ASSEMBLY_ACC=CAM_ASM_000379 /LENGTH=51 /DNA_ID=CAMNT_0028197943 /DNA_START=827 /DNA_END=978 /DNA_ORIENTATION=-